MAPPSSSNSVAGASAAALVPQGQHLGKPALPLTRAFTLIGSRHRAHLNLLSKSVSKSHAALISTNSGFYIRDLASRERVIINGKAQKEAELKDGDQIKIGSFSFKFSNPARTNRLNAPAAREAVLHIDGSDVPMPIEGKTVIIGRRPTADIALIELSASTIHAIIFEIDGKRYIRDLGSRTGTFVNGRPIHHHPLAFNDTIKIGDTVLRYTAAGAEPETADLGQMLEAEGDLRPIPIADAPIEVADLPVEIEPEPEPIESPARVAARRALEEVNLKAAEPEPLEVSTPSAPESAPDTTHREPPTQEEAPIPLAEDFDLLPVDLPPIDSTPAPAEETIDWAAEALAAEQEIAEQKAAKVAPVDSPHFEPVDSIDSLMQEPVQSEPARADAADIPVEILPNPMPPVRAVAQSVPDAPIEIDPIEFVEAPADHGSLKAIAPETLDSFESLLGTQEPHTSQDNAIAPPAEPAFEQADAPSPFEFTTHEAVVTERSISDQPLDEAPSEDLSFVAPIHEEPSLTSESSFEAPIQVEGESAPAQPEVLPEDLAPAQIEAESIEPASPILDEIAPALPEIAPIVEAPPVEPPIPTGRKGRKKREPKPAAQQPAKRGRKKKNGDPDQGGPSAPERVIEPGIEPPIPSAPAAEFSSIEVLDETGPSPESAQAIEPEIALPSEISLDESSADAQSLSDTQFGRAIEAFSGSELGPLVEEPLDFGQESKSAEPFVQAMDVSPSLTISPEPAVEPPAPSGDAMVDEANAFLSHESEVQSQAAPEPDEELANEQSFTAAHDLVPSVQQDAEPELEGPPAAQTLDFHHDVTIEPAHSELTPAPPVLELPPEPQAEIERTPVDQGTSPGVLSTLDPIETADADSELADVDLDWLDNNELPAATQVDELAGPAPISSEPQGTAQPVIEEPAGVEDLSFQEESDDLSALMPSTRDEQPSAAPSPSEPAPTALPSPTAETPAPSPGKSFTIDDLMSGMSRDAGSFLGGLPLPMAPATPAAGGPAKGVVISVKKDAPASRSPLKTAPIASPPSDRAIFDGAAGALDELPDALGKIGDETDVLGKSAAPTRPPATPTPPSAATRPGQKTVQPPRPSRKPAGPPQPVEATLEDLDLADFSAFGAAPRSSPGAFDGLALPPRAQVDVFSMLPIPAADDPFLGGRPAQGNAGDTSQGSENRSRVQRPAQPPVPAASRPSTPGRDAPAPEAPIQPTTPPPAAQPARPTKRKKFKFFGMLLATVGLAGATYAYWPTSYRLQASLQFSGLEKRGINEQHQFVQRLSDQLDGSTRVISTARDALNSTSPGFLSDPVQLERLRSSATLVHGNQFVLVRNSYEPDGDRRRLAALLTAMYEQNIHLRDEAASVDEKRQRDQSQLNDLQLRIADLQQHRTTDAGAVAQRETAAQVERLAFDKVQQAEKTWLATAQKSKSIQDNLEQLQAGKAAIEDDPQIKDLSSKLAQTKSDLAAARNQQGQDIGKDASVVTTALNEFQKQIDATRGSLPSDSPLMPYLLAADPARQQGASALAELIERENADNQNLADLKLRLAEESDATLKSTLATDPQLAGLQQQFAILQRRANTASDSNLPDEATRLFTEADGVKQQVEHRRQELAAAAGPQRQKLIDQMQKQLQNDRANGLQRLAEPLQILAHALPAPGSLPADQRTALDRISSSFQQVQTAGQQLAVALEASSPQGQAHIQELETQQADLAKQLDSRKRQVALENGNTSGNDQKDAAAVAKMQEALVVAQQTEGQALSARTAAHEQLARAQADLARIPAPANSLAADDQQLAQLQDQRQHLVDELDHLSTAATIVPLDPQRNVSSIDMDSPSMLPRFAATGGVLLLGLIATTLLVNRREEAGHPMAEIAPAIDHGDYSHDQRNALAL